jgi:murein hydrolase activator
MNVVLRVLFLWLLTHHSATRAAPVGLDDVREHIQILQAHMVETRSRHDQLQQELQQAEARIAALSLHLEKLATQRQHTQTKLTQLQQDRLTQEKSLHEHRQRLAKQVRASYMSGRQDYLRMLLNQEAPEHLGRMLTYYDYFNRARVRSIKDIQNDLQRIDIISAQIIYEDNELQHIIADEHAQKTHLEQQKQERLQILQHFSETLLTQETRLEQLRKDEERLQNFLRNPAVATPPDSPGLNGLSHSKGQLPWPVLGTVRQKFGSTRSSGGQWQGILISADTGAKVRSIAPGRVIFADWLRNFGHLVILDHGNGYMSLYGYNQNLSATVGDDIASGTLIASVGNSGGQNESGLYFEIRRQGVAQDPLTWLGAMP